MERYRTEIWATFGGAVIIALCALLLYRDYRSGGDVRGAPVGTITFKFNNGQRKGNREIVWYEIESQADIYNQDTIRTAEASEAILRLAGGAELRLDELSMVYVDQTDASVELELEQGSLRVKNEGGSPLRLTDGDRQLAMQAGDAAFSRNGAALDVFVHSGSVRSGADGPAIEAGQAARLSEEGTRVRTAEIRLLQPADGERLLLSQGGRVRFAWQAPAGAALLEVSADGSFRSPLFKQSFAADSHRLSLPPGYYYWRISQGDGPPGPGARFQVLAGTRVRPVRPEAGARLPTARPVDLVWTPGPPKAAYRVLIARDFAFKEIVQERRTSDLRARVELESGDYFWRADPQLPGLEATAGEVGSFTVGTGTPGELRLLAPAFNARIEQSAAAAGLAFRWSTLDPSGTYRLSIERDGEPGQPVAERRVTGDRAGGIRLPGPGTYTWRVTGIGSGGAAAGSGGSTGRFEIVAPALEVAPLFPRQGALVRLESPPRLNLRWRCNRPDARFELALMKEAPGGPQAVLTRNVQATNYVLTDFSRLGPGRYLWRVTARAGEEESRTANIVFNLAAAAPAPPPNRTPEVLYVD